MIVYIKYHWNVLTGVYVLSTAMKETMQQLGKTQTAVYKGIH